MSRQEGHEPVVVYKAANRMEAEVVRARLESCGLRVGLSYESIGRVLGLYIDGFGETRVLVPADQADEARAILATGRDEVCGHPPEGEENTPEDEEGQED
jgi:hypothetical protein